MNIQPLVSVILPTYNREKYIKRAIESVLNQTYKNIELIIINDCSRDKTAEITSNYIRNGSPIVNLFNEENLGLVRSLNKGIKNATGKYIARIDDDDYWCDKNKLAKQVEFLEKNLDYVLVGGGIIRVDESDKEIVRHMLPENDSDIRNLIIIDNTFAHASVVFRKDAWEKVGGYDENLFFSEDWDLWLRLGKIGKFYNFQEYFIRYLQGSQNRSNFRIRSNMRLNIKIRKKYKHNYPNYNKAFLVGWAYYFYTFLPTNHCLVVLMKKIKLLVFGQPVYKSFRGSK